jgi:hypothetical protein
MARHSRKHKAHQEEAKVKEEQKTEKEFDWTEEDLSELEIFKWFADEESFLKTLTKIPGYTDDVDPDELDFTDFGDDEDYADCNNEDCEEDCAPKTHHHHHKHHHHHNNNAEELVATPEVEGGN